MSDEVSVDGVLADLADLGDTPDDVADTLHEYGVQGVREDPDSCPLACYLRQRWGFPHGCVEVTGYVWMDGVGEFAPPLPVERFVTEFDAGEYEFLRDAVL